MSFLQKSKSLYRMVGEGKLLEAFDKYYAEEVVMEEPRGTRKGKALCRQYEEQFLASVKAFHNLEIKAIASNEEEGIVFLEIAMDITFQDDNRVLMEQVVVQHWQDEQIVNERFYYNNA